MIYNQFTKREDINFRKILLDFKIFILLISFLTFFIFYVSADAATYLDPSLKWKTIETLHFRINYYPGLEFHAYKLASIAEETHSDLSKFFKHIPELKTEVVLLDTSDYSNGFTTVIPNPLITIYVSDLGSNNQPFSYDDWLRFVFVHEYTHLLHLDTVEGGPSLLKMLFGRMIFPNALSPQFLIEGIATYFETQKSKGGRGHNARWKAMLRMNAIEESFKSIEQASVATVKWPGGNLPYLYGVFFVDYLVRTYGVDKLSLLSREYGDFILSYGIDGAFSQIYGKSLWILWSDWQEEVLKHANDEAQKIKKEPLTNPNFLTGKGYYILKPKWDINSLNIYYSQRNSDDISQIRKINIETKKDEKILEGIVFDDSLALRQNYIYFSKADVCDNFYFYKDLYRFSLEDKSIERLTYGARISDIAISHDGQDLVFVRNNLGSKTLWLMRLNDEKIQMLSTFEVNSQYFSPKFSPDDKKIIVAKWNKGSQKIVLIDLKSGREKNIIEGNLSLEANPCFSPDGKYVLFDSDVTGVVNIYAVEMKTRKIYKVTNVLGIAQMPEVSGDGKKLAYVNYSSKGYDLALIDFNPSNWKEIYVDDVNHLIISTSEGQNDYKNVILNEYDYNPLPSFIPKFWFPYSYKDENGSNFLAYTGGLDALEQQMMGLQFGYDATAKRPTYGFIYINNQFLPQLSFVAIDVPTAYSWDSSNTIYWERKRDVGAYVGFFDNRVFSEFDKQMVQVGCDFINLTNITSLDSLTTKPSLGNLSGVSISYAYSSLKQYSASIAPEDGILLSLNSKFYSKQFGSNYDITSYTLNGSKYFRVIDHQVLAFSNSITLNYGDNLTQNIYSNTTVALRGYPYQSISGKKTLYGSIKYLYPLSYIENGFGYGYLFLDRLYGTFFFNQIGATPDSVANMAWKRSLGVELNLETINGWGMFPINLILGYAKGLDTDGEDQVYFDFSI